MKKLVFSFLIISGLSAQAQVQWPTITQLNKPWTRWWWEGSAVDKPNLTAAMQQYQAAGLGGLEITPIYGVKGHESEFIDFLSPKWMQMLQQYFDRRETPRTWDRYGECYRMAFRWSLGEARRCL